MTDKRKRIAKRPSAGPFASDREVLETLNIIPKGLPDAAVEELVHELERRGECVNR